MSLRIRDQTLYNERGVIAENYHELQGLGVLRAAREAYPLPKASGASTLRAVFQAAEIALLNLVDLAARAAADLESATVQAATIKMFWARGFHRLLARISLIPHQLGIVHEAGGQHGTLRISESPAFREYVGALGRFDRSVLLCIDSGELDLENAIANESLESAGFNLIHLTRVCNHESTIWERNLAEVRAPACVPSYEEFVVSSGMRAAVYDRVLEGDTYFTQFRGLHQIPETLAEEVNDRLEQAIRDVRYDRLPQALEHLSCVTVLSEAILAALPPIVDNLATSDYHQIRENLGLTSGSHSVGLRFHMFTHLYEQLWEEFRYQVTGKAATDSSDEHFEATFRQLNQRRFEDSRAWMLHFLGDYCLQLRTFVFQWRDEHLNLPRNNLGGEFTKSLTGSPDAIQAVKNMRDGARNRDPLLPLARARDLATHDLHEPAGDLTRYLESAASLDSRILAAAGGITQSRFKDVQERLGFFAKRCPFSAPPRRKA
jgi:tryptophan 2,3-dioxygenase